MKRILLLMLCLLMLAVPAMAKEKPAELLPEDFGARGLLLGQQGTAEAMRAAFGEPLFDNDMSVYGIHVRYYQFRKNIRVGVSMRDNTICDIVIKDQDYIGRDNVRYGATPHKIIHTYGPCERTKIDGLTWYIYHNPENERQKLMLETLAGIYTLESWRITSLPVSLEEAVEWDDAEDDAWDGNDLDSIERRQRRDIDMSGLEPRDRADAEKSGENRWKRGARY